MAPGRPVVVAPFYGGRLDPEAHARWWMRLMEGRSFDVLALQDGVGIGRVTPERAAAYLRALAPVAAAAGVRLWTVVELFQQLHGAPRDERPFEAQSAAFATVRRSLVAQRPLVEKAIGFAVLDYMNPRGSRRARRLYNSYVGWCEQVAAPPASPAPVFENESAVSTADYQDNERNVDQCTPRPSIPRSAAQHRPHRRLWRRLLKAAKTPRPRAWPPRGWFTTRPRARASSPPPPSPDLDRP